MAIAIVALVLSVALVAVLLTRQRERHRPELQPGDEPPQRKKPTRQEKILQKLDPLPEIPTLMDLVREEIGDAGIDEIPGHEGLSDPVKLKVFRRDHRVVEQCPHKGYEYVVADGVEPADAGDDDVNLYCEQCGHISADSDVPGTNSEEETLPE